MMRQRFAQAASSYDQYATIQELSAALISNVTLTHQPKRILDIGCGTGYLTQQMANQYPQSSIDAVDASASMINQFMGRNLRNARPICMQYSDFLPGGQYDLIVSNAALHWMTSPDDVVDGMWNALKPGGRVVGEMGGAGNIARIARALTEALTKRNLKDKSSISI